MPTTASTHELNQGFPPGWQKHQCWSHHLCPQGLQWQGAKIRRHSQELHSATLINVSGVTSKPSTFPCSLYLKILGRQLIKNYIIAASREESYKDVSFTYVQNECLEFRVDFSGKLHLPVICVLVTIRKTSKGADNTVAPEQPTKAIPI